MSANHIEAWIATLDDDSEVRSDAVETFERVPHERCRSVTMRVAGRGEFTVACALSRGERIRMFTRRAHKLGGGTPTLGVPLNMPVLEVCYLDGSFSRLYVHPTHGPIFSTLDLNL